MLQYLLRYNNNDRLGRYGNWSSYLKVFSSIEELKNFIKTEKLIIDDIYEISTFYYEEQIQDYEQFFD